MAILKIKNYEENKKYSEKWKMYLNIIFIIRDL